MLLHAARRESPACNSMPYKPGACRLQCSAMSNGLIELIENLPPSKIVLVGDLMLDRYIFGNAERLSPEAPVPVLHFQHEEYRLGGAGSVLADMAALGARVKLIAAVGADEA